MLMMPKTTAKRIPVYIIIALVIVLAVGGIIASNINRETPATVAELLSLGEKHLLDLEYEQALAQFLKVIEIEPMNVRGYTGAAEAYIGLGDTESAIAILEQGLGVAGESDDITTMLDALIAQKQEPILQELVIEALPKTEYTAGESLILNDLVVKAVYGDGTELVIEDYTTEPAMGDILTVNNRNVKITYAANEISKAAEFALIVVDPKPVLLGLAVEVLPETTYTAGELLNLNGLVIKAIYDDGTELELEDYITEPSAGDILTVNDTQVTVSYSEEISTKTVEFALIVSAPKPEPKPEPIPLITDRSVLEAKINEMVLEPRPSALNEYSRISYDNALKEGMTNYQKLRAVYDIALEEFAPQPYGCAEASGFLFLAFDYVGFKPHWLSGQTKAAGGGWTGHMWVGIELDHQMYYFDIDLPRYGVAIDKCFGVLASETEIFR